MRRCRTICCSNVWPRSGHYCRSNLDHQRIPNRVRSNHSKQIRLTSQPPCCCSSSNHQRCSTTIPSRRSTAIRCSTTSSSWRSTTSSSRCSTCRSNPNGRSSCSNCDQIGCCRRPGLPRCSNGLGSRSLRWSWCWSWRWLRSLLDQCYNYNQWLSIKKSRISEWNQVNVKVI